MIPRPALLLLATLSLAAAPSLAAAQIAPAPPRPRPTAPPSAPPSSVEPTSPAVQDSPRPAPRDTLRLPTPRADEEDADTPRPPRPAARPETRRPPARPAPSQPARDTTPPRSASVDTTSVDTASLDTLEARAVASLHLRTSVDPDTVTVGDRFRVAVFADLPPGARFDLWIDPDSAERWQVIGTPRGYPPDTANRSHRAVATVVAWRTGAGDSLRARLAVRYRADSTATVAIAIPLPVVRSVLPADSTKWKPRPAKDVWGPDRDWRLIAVLATLAVLLLAALVALVVRLLRRPRRRWRGPPLDARQRALAALERARASGLAEAGEWKAFYSQVSAALRGFAQETDARWSTDLTTAELLARMREEGAEEERVETLAAVLESADQAKFARRRFDLDRARSDVDRARQWVETTPSATSEPSLVGAGAGEGAR